MPEKQKNGTYKGRVRIKDLPQKIKTGFKTWNEAKAWELRTAEKLKNPPIKMENLTFYQIAELWLKHCVKRYKASTCSWKANIIDKALQHWGYDPYLEDLSVIMVEDFLDSAQSGKTANRYKRELVTMFTFAIDRGINIENFAKKIKRYPEDKFKRYVPSKEDIETAKAFAEPIEKDIITIAYNTLARAGEIRNIKWDDVNLDKREITLWTGKRDESDRKDDTLEMTDVLFELLSKLNSEESHPKYVLSLNGKKLTKHWLNDRMRKIHKRAEKADVKYQYFSLHCIRHHVAVLLAYKLSLIEISKILRHRNVTTTDIYLRSLVTIKTKGIKVLDDIQKVENADVISFQDALNKKGRK